MEKDSAVAGKVQDGPSTIKRTRGLSTNPPKNYQIYQVRVTKATKKGGRPRSETDLVAQNPEGNYLKEKSIKREKRAKKRLAPCTQNEMYGKAKEDALKKSSPGERGASRVWGREKAQALRLSY